MLSPNYQNLQKLLNLNSNTNQIHLKASLSLNKLRFNYNKLTKPRLKKIKGGQIYLHRCSSMVISMWFTMVKVINHQIPNKRLIQYIMAHFYAVKQHSCNI